MAQQGRLLDQTWKTNYPFIGKCSAEVCKTWLKTLVKFTKIASNIF